MPCVTNSRTGEKLYLGDHDIVPSPLGGGQLVDEAGRHLTPGVRYDQQFTGGRTPPETLTAQRAGTLMHAMLQDRWSASYEVDHRTNLSQADHDMAIVLARFKSFRESGTYNAAPHQFSEKETALEKTFLNATRGKDLSSIMDPIVADCVKHEKRLQSLVRDQQKTAQKRDAWQQKQCVEEQTRRRHSLSVVASFVIVGLIAIGCVVMVLIQRNYLTLGPSGISATSTPGHVVGGQMIYTASVVNRQFNNRNIWVKPWELVGDAVIEGNDPLKDLNILAKNGNLTIRGTVTDSRITVQNGTLTLNNVSNSVLSARRIVVNGQIEKSREKATEIDNNSVGAGNHIHRLAGNQPVLMPLFGHPETF